MKKFYRKHLIILLALLALVGIVWATYHAFNKNPVNQSTDHRTPEQRQQQKDRENNEKKVFAESTKETENPGVEVPVPTSSDTVSVSASQPVSTEVTIVTKLQGFASGVCKISAQNGSDTYTAEAPILYQPEYSSCAGFTIPTSELGNGTWSIVLNVTPTGGQTISKQTSLEVKL